MVHPYLRRREGKEKPEYPRPELRAVLEKTLGVPLFQEQAMKVAIVGAGFTPAEADQLRRAMATFKFTGGVSHFYDKLVGGMVERGYPQDFAERTFKQIEGFGCYGFPESHAASFAKIAYASVLDEASSSRRVLRGAAQRPADGVLCARADRSRRARARRRGAAGLRSTPAAGTARWSRPAAATWRCGSACGRSAGSPTSTARRSSRRAGRRAVRDRRGGLAARAACRAPRSSGWPKPTPFTCIGEDRRQGLWKVRGLGEAPLPLFAAADEREANFQPEGLEPAVALRPMTDGREVVEDYRSLQLSLRAHPLTFVRDELDAMRIVRCADLATIRDGRHVEVAGVILVRQKPGSAKGVLFITIEDETGIANGILWPDRFESAAPQVMSCVDDRPCGAGCRRKARSSTSSATASSIMTTCCARSGGWISRLRRAAAMARSNGGGPDPRDPSFPRGRTLGAPPFGTLAEQEEIVRVRSHDFH